jgi:type IV pilus biogenesis protein CpaD/CtpE
MKSTKILIVAAALAPLALTACEGTDPFQSKPVLHPSFGDAVRHNMAVQIINPDGHPDLSPPPMDGARAADAVQRYRAGKTTEVVQQKTSQMGGEGK